MYMGIVVSPENEISSAIRSRSRSTLRIRYSTNIETPWEARNPTRPDQVQELPPVERHRRAEDTARARSADAGLSLARAAS